MSGEWRLEDVFVSGNPARDKFLARLFGLFNEEVVRHWCRCPGAAYEDLGRPTLRGAGEHRGHTLDFTLRHRATGNLYVAEMKCELELDHYRYLRLTDAGQIRHHRGVAFQKFLQLARQPDALAVRVGGRPVRVRGAILIWGAVDPDGRAAAMAEYGFADVLSVEAMLADLRRWRPAPWRERVGELERWSSELFRSLT